MDEILKFICTAIAFFSLGAMAEDYANRKHKGWLLLAIGLMTITAAATTAWSLIT